MAAVHIRQVPDETVVRLKARAAAHGRSLEAELRIVLEEASLAPMARKRRQINWTTLSSGISSPWDRGDAYPDEYDDD
jgi:plasmid stability protein